MYRQFHVTITYIFIAYQFIIYQSPRATYIITYFSIYTFFFFTSLYHPCTVPTMCRIINKKNLYHLHRSRTKRGINAFFITPLFLLCTFFGLIFLKRHNPGEWCVKAQGIYIMYIRSLPVPTWWECKPSRGRCRPEFPSLTLTFRHPILTLSHV